MNGIRGFCAIAALAVIGGRGAHAAMIDLTPGAGSGGVINGAVFEFNTVHSSGTGVLEPFVRLQRSGIQEGYNTSASDLPFDEKSGTWTHDLQLQDLPIVNVNGVEYFELMLDINERSGGNKNLLSLDAVQIYTSPTGSQSTTNVSMLGDLRYDMDAGGDSWVLMDANLTSGSGTGDMRALIPVSNFAGASPSDFVYLYSRFGENETAGGGFEEWSIAMGAVPGPASLTLLLGATLIGNGRNRRRP